MKESILLYTVRTFGFFIRCLPLNVALMVGRMIGMLVYYFDTKHKSQAYGNLRMAFGQSKSPREIRKIVKELFVNYSLNFIDLLRMPLVTREKFEKLVTIEGKEHITNALKKGNGVIFLAMHFGSWEMASLSCAMVGYPYKMMVKTQQRYSRLDDLLNSYRAAGGYEVLTRGVGTRDFIKSLQKNEVIGLVVDQGGKNGVLVPFFKRKASMSVGAVRMGLKQDVPVCFSVIYREKRGHHRMIIHEPMKLINTGDSKEDVVTNLKNVTKIMEKYIRRYPSEYMWFYKIWKYSKESQITILSDGKTGHLRQSETVAKMTEKLLAERGIKSVTDIVEIKFRNKLRERFFHLMNFIVHPLIFLGRLDVLKLVLTKDSFKQVMALKSDFIISCGSSIAGMNNLLSQDNHAKSIVVLKPGVLKYDKFDLVILPQHDVTAKEKSLRKIAVTKAALNLVDQSYLDEQSRKLLNRYSHLKNRSKFTIGLFVGGDSKKVFLSEQQMTVLIHQVKQVSDELNADIIVTTSRRTPAKIERLIQKEFKNDERCPLAILANKDNVPEAVGGILGLADIVLVSGDSISMISEAASSGKYTVVFSPQKREVLLRGSNKHEAFIEKLNAQGFILSSNVKDIAESIYGIAKNKIQTKKIDDDQIILEALRFII